MTSKPDPVNNPQEPGPRPGLSRRRFLKLAGAQAVGAAMLGAGLRVISEASRGRSETEKDAPRRLRRWAMVIDLRSCDGCQSRGAAPLCTAACIRGRFAPEPMEWLEVYERELPGGGTQFVPTPCQHCQNAPCVNVCPVGATFATPEGTVLIDQQRCIGCRLCMAACPFDRRFFNWGDPVRPPAALFAEYSPETQFGAPRGTVMKCDFCPDVARMGGMPYCVRACPSGALYWGDLEEDLATNGKEVVQLSRFLTDHNAYRLKEELGTQPRVYYIPGHGQRRGRNPYRRGRLATRWPWTARVKGARTWKRSSG